MTISESKSGWGTRVFSAITAPITALQREWTAAQKALALQPERVSAAAKTLYEFDQLSKIPDNPIGPSDTWYNRHSLHFSASKAWQAIEAAKESDPFLWRVRGTLEDPKGIYKMSRGAATKLMKTLKDYGEKGGMSVGGTWMSVITANEQVKPDPDTV